MQILSLVTDNSLSLRRAVGSGRELDLGSRGCGFEPYLDHFIVSLSKTLYALLSIGLTQEDPSQDTEKLLTGT